MKETKTFIQWLKHLNKENLKSANMAIIVNLYILSVISATLNI